MPDANTVTVVGNFAASSHNPTIRRTTDGGASWRFMGAPPGTGLLSAISFADANTGISVGGGGVVIGTTDGLIWTRQTSGSSENLLAVSFVRPVMTE